MYFMQCVLFCVTQHDVVKNIHAVVCGCSFLIPIALIVNMARFIYSFHS